MLPNGEMPWVYAKLRGTRVLARVDADGNFVRDGGRVEIRYRATDSRAYQAAAANLLVEEASPILADDGVVAGAPVQREAVLAGERAAKKAPSRGAERGAVSRAPGVAQSIPTEAFVVYTDGACSGNPGPAGAGLVVVAPEGELREGFEYLGQATNNVAELTAILRGLEAVPPHAHAVIHTDSKYAIGVLTQNWKAKANQDLIAHIRTLLAGRTGITFRYVPGHQGVPLNERADELARLAVQSRATKLPHRKA